MFVFIYQNHLWLAITFCATLNIPISVSSLKTEKKKNLIVELNF